MSSQQTSQPYTNEGNVIKRMNCPYCDQTAIQEGYHEGDDVTDAVTHSHCEACGWEAIVRKRKQHRPNESVTQVATATKVANWEDTPIGYGVVYCTDCGGVVKRGTIDTENPEERLQKFNSSCCDADVALETDRFSHLNTGDDQ